MFTARRTLYGFTLGLAAAATGLTVLGFKFNATMEQSQVGMTFLLKNANAAKLEMADLLKISQATIFDLPHISEAGRRLLGMGFDVSQTNEYLMAMSENLAAMNQPVDTMDRIITAFGQIRARGKLAGQEMLQLVNAQVPVYDILREELHLTGKQLANIADTGISADVALSALSRGMTKKFGGANAAMLNTVNGQWQKFRENTEIIMGAIMMSPFTAIQKRFPELLKTMDAMTTAMKDDGFYAMVRAMDAGVGAGGRLTGAITTLHIYAQQLAQFWNAAFGPALRNVAILAGIIIFVFLKVTGTVLALASHIRYLTEILTLVVGAYALWRFWLIATWVWGLKDIKMLRGLTAWLWKYATGARASAFATQLWTWATTVATFALNDLKLMLYSVPVVGWVFAAIAVLYLLEQRWHLVTRAVKFLWNMLKRLFNYVSDNKDVLLNLIPVIGPALFVGKKILGHFATGGTAGQTGPYMVGERGPEIVNLPGRATVTPMTTNLVGSGAGGITVQVFPQAINLDGRQIAEVVWKHKLDRFARR